MGEGCKGKTFSKQKAGSAVLDYHLRSSVVSFKEVTLKRTLLITFACKWKLYINGTSKQSMKSLTEQNVSGKRQAARSDFLCPKHWKTWFI